MKRHKDVRSGRRRQAVAADQDTAGLIGRRTMMKTAGLGAAALAVPGLVAGCSSSSGGRTSIVLEETKPEVIPYFDNLVAKFNASQKSVRVTHDSRRSSRTRRPPCRSTGRR